MITLTTTLYVDQSAFPNWALPSLLDEYINEYNPNDIVMVSPEECPALVKHVASRIWEVGEFAYLLTSVPRRRFWAILPSHVHVLVRNENNSRPQWSGLNALDAWVYWALGGMPVDKARARAKTPPKKRELAEECALAWQAWEEVGVFGGKAERIRTPLELDYETVEDLPGTFKDWIGKVMAVDIETTGLDPRVHEVIGVSISVRERQGWWIPWKTEGEPLHRVEEGGTIHMPPITRRRDEEERLLAAPPPSLHAPGPPVCPPVLRAVLESPACPAITWNGGFDWYFLNYKGVRMAAPAGDGKALAYLLGLQHLSPKLELKALARQMLKRQVVTYAGAVGDEDTLVGIDPDLLLLYACQDADVALGLHNLLIQMVEDLA